MRVGKSPMRASPPAAKRRLPSEARPAGPTERSETSRRAHGFTSLRLEMGHQPDLLTFQRVAG